jgi:hypothetical protein
MVRTVYVIAMVLALAWGLTMTQTAYADSLYIPAWERGYVEAWSKLPMSSSYSLDANYTSGYGNGVHDRGIWGKVVHLGTLPAHTIDNYRAFYGGFYHGVSDADQATAKWDHNKIVCPPGHTSEYCAGYTFGYNAGDFANNPPDTDVH